MFVQVIQGKVSNVDPLRAAMDRWQHDLAADAPGYLGSTGGVTEDGRFIELARFESEETARSNSARPEQDRWWSETAALFDGEATFMDSSDVMVDLAGNPDDAHFVQIMRGKVSDPARAKALMTADMDKWADFRPEILGSVTVGYPDGGYTTAIYFTSEAEAREGEHKQPPPEIAAEMEEMSKLETDEVQYYDLKNPWVHSPNGG